MRFRRAPMLLVVLAAIVGVVVGARDRVPTATARYSTASLGWMPSAPLVGGLTESWFCPGVPATGVDDVGGSIVIVNRSDERRVGSVLLYNEQSQNMRLDLDVAAWSTATVDLDASLPGEMVAGLVEIDGGGTIVEQRAFHPSGNSVAPCSNATSDEWYLADGFTAEQSLDQVVLSNPYDQTVVASLDFATREGPHPSGSYSSLTVPPRSTRVLDLGAPGAGAQGEPMLAITVTATRGRLVVGRSQRFLGGGRLGTQVTLAVPAAREQWWFANGQLGGGVSERYSIYNPTEDDVEVDVIFLGLPPGVDVVPEPIDVEAGHVVAFDPGSVEGLPEGRFATVFATLSAEAIVVERATTQTIGGDVATAVTAGATPRVDGYLATTWFVPLAPSEPTTAALVIHNADNADGTITVSAIGASGPVPVPGLESVPIGAARFVVLDLTDPVALGRPLIIESGNRIFVERSLPNGRGELRTTAWALPAS